MKRITTFLLLLLFALSNVNASHEAGCDLTYQCLGGNTYLITLSFYRDCSGVSADGTALINFTSSCGSTSVSLSQIAGTGQEITPVCPNQTTSCSGGSLYGVQEWVYQGQVTLAPCANWTMSYLLCCRNPSGTISDPTSAYVYIPATLNNLAAPCNSSPTFSNFPTTIICNGQQFCFNHGAIDPDGDSLSYSLVTPYDHGPGGSPPNVSYIGGYTPTQFLPSSPPITLDAATGDLCMTPTQNITTVCAILVKEWRLINGVMTCIGSVLRDMQLTVVTCTNQVPTLSGINPGSSQWSAADSSYVWHMCAGETLDFWIFPHDTDNPPDNLNITWNTGIPDATWSVDNNDTPNAAAHFTWTPGAADLSSTPHCFTATIKDNNCPYIGMQVFSYCVYVSGVGVVLNPINDTTICMGENYTITAIADTAVTNIQWTINGTSTTPLNDTTLILNSNTLGPGVYTVAVTASGGIAQCSNGSSVVVTIVANPVISVTPSTSAICYGGSPVNLIAGSGCESYVWDPITGLSPTSGDTVYASPLVATTYTITGTTINGCSGSTTATVNVSQLQASISNVDSVSCYGYSDGQITASGANGILPYSYNWSNNQTNATATGLAQGNYTVTVTDAIGCTSTQSVTLNNPPQISINLTPTDETCPMYCNGQIAVNITGNIPPYSYIWNTQPVQSTQTATSLCAGEYFVTVNYSPNNCPVTSSATIITTTFITADFTANPTEGYLPLTVNFTYTGYGATIYNWEFGDGGTSNLQNPSHTYTMMGLFPAKLTVSSGAPNNCPAEFQVIINAIQPSSIETYNIITPNGDGMNDEFTIKSAGIRTIKVEIFNRWGEKVYTYNNNEGFTVLEQNSKLWTGDNMKGKPCDDGTYFFIVNAVGYDSKEYHINGSVTLLR
jgi:gliding motility-associated-like protein